MRAWDSQGDSIAPYSEEVLLPDPDPDPPLSLAGDADADADADDATRSVTCDFDTVSYDSIDPNTPPATASSTTDSALRHPSHPSMSVFLLTPDDDTDDGEADSASLRAWLTLRRPVHPINHDRDASMPESRSDSMPLCQPTDSQSDPDPNTGEH